MTPATFHADFAPLALRACFFGDLADTARFVHLSLVLQSPPSLNERERERYEDQAGATPSDLFLSEVTMSLGRSTPILLIPMLPMLQPLGDYFTYVFRLVFVSNPRPVKCYSHGLRV